AIVAASRSTWPTAIVGAGLLETLCAATVAIVSVKFFEKLSIFQPRREPTPVADDSPYRSAPTPAAKVAFDDESLAQPPATLAPLGLIALVLLGVCFMLVFVLMAAAAGFGLVMPARAVAE